MQTYVYAATCEGHPLVKIGASKTPHLRVKAFSSEGCGDFRVVGLLEGGFKKEKEIHVLMDESRSFGEWFWLTEKVKEFILTMLSPDAIEFPAPERIIRHVDKSHFFDWSKAKRALMEKVVESDSMNGIELAALCSKAGVPDTVAYRFQCSQHIPLLKTIGKLEKALQNLPT